jgi:cytosine/adenosine deaminase-related metal-dependent hydrolase
MAGDLTLIVHDALLLTLDPAEPEPFAGWLAVDGEGRIAAIGRGAPPPAPGPTGSAPALVDAGGAIVAPGFVSAHSHLFTSGSRGLGTDQSLYGWIEAMTRWTVHATPEDLYWLTVHGALDFLDNGITTAYDFTAGRLDFDAGTPQHGAFGGRLRPAEQGEAQFRAKLDAGIRFVNSVMLDDAAGSRDEVLGRLDDIVDFASKHADDPRYLGSAISGAVQWAADRSTAEIEVEAMARHGLINQPHFLESPHEAAAQRAKFAWYRDAGALGPDLVFGHFVQATDALIAEAAEAGCGMVWQPTSNGRLASGIADVPRCRELGMRVGVGLDDQACTDCSDPFQNMRIGMYLLRASRQDPAAMPVREMLELHTLGSARVLGIEADVGSLEVGKYADFLVVDPRRPDTGPVWDPVATYVLACGLRNLRQVWVGGRLVSQDGVATNPLSAAASAEVHGRLGAIARRRG